MKAYSFLDTQVAISGPGGAFSLSQGGIAKEGISYAYTGEKSTMTIGADGSGMHSLHAGKSGRVTVRILKTSPINSLLSSLFNFQTLSAANHGQNIININNTTSGDSITCAEGAFVVGPPNTYAEDANLLEWTFDFIRIDVNL